MFVDVPYQQMLGQDELLGNTSCAGYDLDACPLNWTTPFDRYLCVALSIAQKKASGTLTTEADSLHGH